MGIGYDVLIAEPPNMKAILTLFTLFFFTALQAQRINSKLIGKWEAVGSDNAGVGLEVIDSSQIYVVYGTEKKKLVSFKADFSKSPAGFDFMVKDSSELIPLKSLVHFVNDDLIQWQLFDSATRPDHFTDKSGEMVYLRRKK